MDETIEPETLKQFIVELLEVLNPHKDYMRYELDYVTSILSSLNRIEEQCPVELLSQYGLSTYEHTVNRAGQAIIEIMRKSLDLSKPNMHGVLTEARNSPLSLNDCEWFSLQIYSTYLKLMSDVIVYWKAMELPAEKRKLLRTKIRYTFIECCRRFPELRRWSEVEDSDEYSDEDFVDLAKPLEDSGEDSRPDKDSEKNSSEHPKAGFGGKTNLAQDESFELPPVPTFKPTALHTHMDLFQVKDYNLHETNFDHWPQKPTLPPGFELDQDEADRIMTSYHKWDIMIAKGFEEIWCYHRHIILHYQEIREDQLPKERDETDRMRPEAEVAEAIVQSLDCHESQKILYQWTLETFRISDLRITVFVKRSPRYKPTTLQKYLSAFDKPSQTRLAQRQSRPPRQPPVLHRLPFVVEDGLAARVFCEHWLKNDQIG